MKTAKRIGYVALLFTLLALTADPLVGAVEKSDWGSLKQIAAGQTIKVTVKHGASSQGDFQSATEDALVLRVAGEDRSIARDTVRRVSLKTNGHRGKHALIGAAIGARGGLGAGIAIDNALACSPNAIVCTGKPGQSHSDSRTMSCPLYRTLHRAIQLTSSRMSSCPVAPLQLQFVKS